MTDDLRARRRRWIAVACATVGSALGLGALAVVRGGGPSLAPAPTSLAHREHGVACADCHSRGVAARASCTTCHGEHRSAREAHGRLARAGELTCTMCHAAHGGEGISVRPNGDVVRWGGRGEAVLHGLAAPGSKVVNVPTVRAAACAACHDVTAPTDAAARCIAGGSSRCFGEHVSPSPTAFLGWTIATRVLDREAAGRRRAERSAEPPSPSSVNAEAVTLPLGGATLAVSLGFALLRSRRRRSDPKVVPSVPARVRRLPVIDPTTCLGCNACIDACPFDVLTLNAFVAKVARPEACCGVVACAEVCPNGSLTIAEGERLPGAWRVDEHLESRDVEGLFVAGDVSGVPLLKNAVEQGVRVAERVASQLGKLRSARGTDEVDLAIVGAGPAGLSAGLRAKALGLTTVVVEQATVASSIASFPRGKIVQDAPIELPVSGEFVLADCTKEELLRRWQRLVRTGHLDVREGVRVVSLEASTPGTGAAPSQRVFDLRTAAGDTLRARTVLFAVGRRGTPRTLDVPTDARARVYYSLIDARTFAGSRVVIVGLGDVAMEAAVALSDQPGTVVTVLARGDSFKRGRARNVEAVTSRAERGRVELVFGASVTHIDAEGVRAVVAGVSREFPCDHVFLLLGGSAAAPLLEGAGFTRETGDAVPDEP